MRTRRPPSSAPDASSIGLGCNAMSGEVYGRADTEGVAIIGAALDAGVTLLDTADFASTRIRARIALPAEAARTRCLRSPA
ncbi:hypothetical protein [Streptomyces sp. NBC_00344]|uniref:hypothetical protein n=1 Tax=Streptomyces sp. NBC_00344 TaxID=2975720 RepID=UPI002E1D817F